MLIGNYPIKARGPKFDPKVRDPKADQKVGCPVRLHFLLTPRAGTASISIYYNTITVTIPYFHTPVRVVTVTKNPYTTLVKRSVRIYYIL